MEVGKGGGANGKQEVVQCEWPLRGGGDDGEMGGGQRSPQGQPGDGWSTRLAEELAGAPVLRQWGATESL